MTHIRPSSIRGCTLMDLRGLSLSAAFKYLTDKNIPSLYQQVFETPFDNLTAEWIKKQTHEDKGLLVFAVDHNNIVYDYAWKTL